MLSQPNWCLAYATNQLEEQYLEYATGNTWKISTGISDMLQAK